jgi:hypothetical protein
VRFAGRIGWRVRVVVVVVVGVKVVVLHGFMVVRMLVTFGQVEPETQGHEDCRRTESEAYGFPQEHERDGRTGERSG